MPLLAASELAVMFWTGNPPEETLATLTALGIHFGQIGIPGDYELGPEAAAAWKSAAKASGFTIYTVFAAYTGESYADVTAVRDTVGLVPPATRAGRLERSLQVLEFAHEIGAPSIATHIGCVPTDTRSQDYRDIVDAVRAICDRATLTGQSFALETGQETADELLAFIREVNRSNLGINFDPANMIVYGTGEPVEALQTLQPLVLSVHCKDGRWPLSPGVLGSETPLGQGDVDWVRFFSQLEDGGYRGPLAIEREASDERQRMIDIQAGIGFLAALKLSSGKRV